MGHLQRLLAWLGLACLGLTGLLILLRLGGAVPAGTFTVAGQSEIRTLAELAVIGCVLAALGYWKN